MELEESQFDSQIGECPECHGQWTSKEYLDIIKSTDNKD